VTVRHGVRTGVPVAVAVFFVAMSFGAAARPVLGEAATITMSCVLFAGGAQFAATAVLASGGSAAVATLAGTLLNARFVPMCMAVAPSLSGGRLRRALGGLAVNDASWALANEGRGRFDPTILVGATIVQYPAWTLGTVLGVFGGEALGDPRALGLDAVFPAFFLAVLAEEVSERRGLWMALAGAAVTLALVPFAPLGVAILAAVLPALTRLRAA
jgi:predicted branched-subunit amino acid permease